MSYETDETDEIDGYLNYENNVFRNNGRNDYFETNECWNIGIDELLNNEKSDSANYVSNVFQNNAKSAFHH